MTTNIISFPKLNLEFTVDRVAFHIGSRAVYWYGIIIACGMVLSAIYAIRMTKKAGLDSDAWYDLLLWAIPISIIGARTYYVLFSLDSYRDHPIDVVKIWEGGLAIYGGVIAAIVTAYIFLKKRDLPVLAYFDTGAQGMIMGQAIGRWGNFMNAEAFGGETGSILGMSINGAAPVHPAFLYESLWNLAGLIVLRVVYKKLRFDGRCFFGYLIWYGFGRFFIEGLRSDSLYLTGTIRVSQLVSIVAFIVGVAGEIICSRKQRNVTAGE